MTTSHMFRGLYIALSLLLVIGYCVVSAFLANGVTKASRETPQHIPSEYDLPYEDVNFFSRGDTTNLSGWLIHEGIEKKTLIFVHGLGGNRASNDALDLADRLWSHGYNILMFDLRGHGLSAEGRISGGYFEQNDVLGAFDFLVRKGTSPREIGIIGFSMGAATSILAAEKEPNIRALVSDSTYADVSDLIVQEVSRTTPIPNWIVPVFIPGTKAAAQILYGIKISALIPEYSARKISFPIFFIHAADDERIPVGHSERVLKNSHKDSQLWVVHKVEHSDAFIGYPDTYTTKVIAYFDNLLGK